MDDNSVLDTTTKAHDAVLDDAHIASAVPAVFDKARGSSLGVVVVANEDHRSANLKLAALTIWAQSGAIGGVDDAHLATIERTSEIKELVSGSSCKDIYRVINASSAVKQNQFRWSTTSSNYPYHVSVIPNPAAMTKDTAEGFLLNFFMVAAKACAVFETTASPPLLIRLMEDRSKVPYRSVRFSRSRVSLERRKFGAKASSMD
jgi:hypothetical protein